MLFNRETRSSRRRKKQAGITLTEVLVTLVIIGLIAGATTVAVLPALDRSKTTRAEVDIRSISSAIFNYSLDVGSVPTQSQGLQALVEQPTDLPRSSTYDQRGYLGSSKVPVDPWGRPYIYEVPSTRSRQEFDLYSLGADGQEGGEGQDADIGNWDS